MDRKLGSRDLPLILDDNAGGVTSPGKGGGSGDSRINLRGFDQRNVAVMINGVPVNDMENGWVYWSNFDGLGDATSSIQVQRGLGASNLAIASVGGTLNIITDNRRRAARIPGQTGGRERHLLQDPGRLLLRVVERKGPLSPSALPARPATAWPTRRGRRPGPTSGP